MAKPTAALKEFIQNYEGSNVFFVIAGISGALAVGLGAYGSHSSVLNEPANAKFKKVFESANRLHFFHNIVLLALPLVRRPALVGWLMVFGQLLFCGSCYVSAIAQNAKLSKLAPYGGWLLIASWLAIAF